MDATIKEAVEQERERILSELMEFNNMGVVHIATFKMKEIIMGPSEPVNLLASSGCGCGGNCGCS